MSVWPVVVDGVGVVELIGGEVPVWTVVVGGEVRVVVEGFMQSAPSVPFGQRTGSSQTASFANRHICDIELEILSRTK